MMNTARNIATARNQWRQAMTEARIDVAKVDGQAVAVWPLAAGKSARYAFALASRQASPDTAAGFWITVASMHQIADLLAILGAMEWKISHGPIISLIPGDMHGEIAGRKRAGTAAFELFNGPALVVTNRVKPNKPRADRCYLTGPALGQGNSVRSESGRGRVEYAPCWNESAPWISYYNGTAGRSFKTIGDAARHFRDHYRDPLELPDLAAVYRP